MLDVGCGTGQLAAALATEARAKVWGVDASDEMVAIAREAVPAGVGIRQALAEQPAVPRRLVRPRDHVARHPSRRTAGGARRGPARRRADGEGCDRDISRGSLPHLLAGPYFPSIRLIDEQRFPTEATLAAELADAGFPTVETRRVVSETALTRADALARIRGRHISTFDLLPPDELDEGTARAERDLPEEVVARLDQLIVVGRAG